MISSKVSIVKSAVFMVLACVCAFAAEGDAAAAETAVKTAVNPAIFYAIATIMGIGSIAASMAVGKIGAAAMGAAAEKPELLGKAIAFVGLGEGIALFGFLISLFLVFKI
ncbi:MAG: hypothetical protein IKP00_12930 [Victivallales bacterium]|nr:hypothetical protein [Victivallales bacterium]